MANTSTNPLAGENSRQGRARVTFASNEKEHQQPTMFGLWRVKIFSDRSKVFVSTYLRKKQK